MWTAADIETDRIGLQLHETIERVAPTRILSQRGIYKMADGGRGGFTRPALAVDIEAAEEADGGGVPEPGTELGALDDARLAELSGPG